LTSHRTNTI
jgi:calnexin